MYDTIYNMKKLIRSLIIIILMCPLLVKAFTIDELYSKNILVYNLDENKVLYSKNSDEKVSIASLTKIMTTIVSIENIKDLDEKITITDKMLENVPYDASIAGLEVGDKLTYKDLLYASLIPSGADATDSLAVSISGTIDKFVELMNKKSEELNMKNTHFANTTGLDQNNHYSTLEDLLILIKYALNNDTFKEIFETKTYTTSNNLKLKSTIDYYNKDLKYDISYVLGSKTGFTDDAGLCLLTLSNIDNTNIITITTNAPYSYENSKNMMDLNTIKTSLDDSFEKVTLIKKDELLITLDTKYAKEKKIVITSPVDITKYVEKPYDKNKLKTEYTGDKIISYKTKKDTKLGQIKITYNDELVDIIDIKLDHDLKFSLWVFIKDNILIILLITIVLFIFNLIIKKNKRRKKRRRSAR